MLNKFKTPMESKTVSRLPQPVKEKSESVATRLLFNEEVAVVTEEQKTSKSKKRSVAEISIM